MRLMSPSDMRSFFDRWDPDYTGRAGLALGIMHAAEAGLMSEYTKLLAGEPAVICLDYQDDDLASYTRCLIEEIVGGSYDEVSPVVVDAFREAAVALRAAGWDVGEVELLRGGWACRFEVKAKNEG